jgi:hypothetical protein
MIILHGNLLDCICLDNKRIINEKEEIVKGLVHLIDVLGLDNDDSLLFDGILGLLTNSLGLLFNGQMILLGRHHLQDNSSIKK